MTRPIPPRCTVAVPLLNEARYFPGLLAALLAQTYPREHMEILLVDGGSVDGTREMAEQAAADHAHIRFLHNERGMAAAALNKALAEAQGEYFVRLDARTRPEPDYVWACVRRLQEGRWAGVAGPQIAGGETKTARVHALVLNHPLGAGAAAYRRARRPTVVDSLYLGAYPTSLLREIGGWDESLLATEDFELNARLRCRGGALLVDPAIRSIYLTRESLCEIKRQYARYGAWRAALLRRAREHIRPRHLAPALLPPTLACSLALAIWRPHFLLIPAVYLALAALAGLQLSREASVHAWPRLFATFLILHLAWGLGFWRALLSRIRQPEIKLV